MTGKVPDDALTVPAETILNEQFVGRNGQGIIHVAVPRMQMTRQEALRHAAWLVAVADDDGEFGAILAAVRST